MTFSEWSKKKRKNEEEKPTFSEWHDQKYGITHDDIAPVRQTPTQVTTKAEDKNKGQSWFKSGAFADGYQIGDLTKTILGSAKDVSENVVAGVLGMGEKVVDAGAYIVGGVGGMFGADDFKDDMQDFIKKDLYDEEKLAKNIWLTDNVADAILTGLGKDPISIDSEENSVFGEKADSLAQSGGELLGTIGLQAVGVPWFVTTGVTSFGGGVESASKEGATFGEAGMSAAVTMGAEILTEKLFGGSGLGEKGLINLEPLTKGISNKVVKALAGLGVDMAAEGSEEVVSSVFSRLGTKLYKEESVGEILLSEEAVDEYIDSFVGGAVLGGVMNTGKSVKSIKTGRDYRTGLTENEQKVFDRVYNDRLAEAENDGQKLSKKQKAELYDSVLNDMQKGYISSDTIEEVLGGETYNTYKNTIDSEDALIKEYEELRQMKKGDMNDIQQDRLAELKAMNLTDTTKRDSLKSQLSDEVQKSLTRQVGKDGKIIQTDDYLMESYNEKARRSVAYEADLSQYDEKTKATIQKAIDSKILNNTRRTHEFVDMIAKISADKGVLFDFTNNEKLKESGFAVDGKTVNGYVTKDGVTLNIQSAKSLNSVVGHEIAHVLEGTELYGDLQKAMFDYAKSKKDYDGRRKSLEDLYKDVKDADIDAELTADLVGDYLFTDPDFVNNLSTKHRNVFQKIYDEIKYLCKIATKGSKEARELEKVKRAFDKAYKQSGKASENTKYSMSADSDGKKLTKEQSEYFKDSKMRDDNGNLKVMYHGSQDAGFHVFDPSISDDDTSLFFVDRNDVAASYSGTSETYEAQTIRTAEDMEKFIESIGVEGYEVVEKDGKFTLLYEGERVAASNTAQGIYDEFCWYEGVGEGDANYKVYLNLTNPLEIDAKGRPWNKIDAEFSQEVYDKYKSLTAEEKAALIDLAEWEDFRIFNSEIQEARENELASAYEKMGEDCNIYDLFSVATDEFSEESMRENARHYLKTRDFAQRAKEGGYDGVIFKNLVDNGGYSNGSEGASTVAIAFDSNQIKSVANEKPTADPDIRFSLSKPVEETPDLIAAHNLTTDNLLKALELGGLPMPSVAITRADSVHDSYGDISLILRKSAIDPKANRDNKIYSGDVWSPVYPTIEFKPSEEITRKISNKYYELARKHGYDDVRPMYRFVNDTEDALKRDKGEQGMLNALYDDTGMMQVYLLDKGLGKVETIQEEIRTELSDVEVAEREFFIKELGTDIVDGVMFNGDGSLGMHRKQYWENHGEQIKETYKKFLTEEYGFTEEEVQNVFNGMKTFDFLKLVRNAHLYRKNGRSTVRYETNTTATNEAIRQKAADGYKEWVDSLFKGLEEKTGIRNNIDYFTPSGNRRSWDALHWENTLENVVRIMRQQGNGENTLFAGHGIWGAAANEYRSIDDVKADSDRLKRVPQEEYEKARGEIGTRLHDVAERIKDKGESNPFIATDNAIACIVDAIRHARTADGILKQLKQYSQLTVTEADAKEIVSIVEDVAKMPTEYFEAKPRRAVGFDEVGVFVIPRNADIKLKQELLSRGYSIAEYDPDVEGDRQKVVNSFEEYKFSLSPEGSTPETYGRYNVSGKDIALESAPVNETPSSIKEEVSENTVPVMTDEEYHELRGDPNLDDLYQQQEALQNQIIENQAEYEKTGKQGEFESLVQQYVAVTERIQQMEAEETKRDKEFIESITDEDIPPEVDAPYYGEAESDSVDDPFEDRDYNTIGKRNVKAYMYENPEVKPFFQKEAEILLGEYNSTQKPETIYNGALKYHMNYEAAQDIPTIYRTPRIATPSIEILRDEYNMSYDDIEKGLKAIIEDNGAENIAAAKKIEFMLNNRLLNGYVVDGIECPADQDYINLLKEKQITEYNEESYRRYLESIGESEIPIAEATPAEDIGPVKKKPAKAEISGEEYAAKNKWENPRTKTEQPNTKKTAEIMDSEPETAKAKSRGWSKFVSNFVDKQGVFETLSLKTKNRELMGKADQMHRAESSAQWLIGNGTAGVKSLNDIRAEVESTGKTKEFYEYLYHRHNVDRMNLESRYKDVKNKPVFGDDITAEKSQEIVNQYDKAEPKFTEYAQDVYDYMNHLRKQLVDSGVISQETADLWAEMYPHYVPIRRLGDSGLNINVPLDTGRTGVNAPIKRAKGGSRDILPLFDTMAMRTEQTYKAIARNRFGVELKNTLGSTIESNTANLDEVIDSIDNHEELLQKGENGRNPTFTVFENGEKVTFEITEDMYDALKPKSEGMAYTNKVLNTASNIRKGLTTEYNPVFMATNAIKDAQDILINSQHAGKTYAKLPTAFKELATKGKWYTEYMENGGEQNTYFDGNTNTFKAEDRGFKKVVGMPLRAISKANNFIERAPRLAEYIASREAGASVEVAMLDAARVTTNFAAGGDVTKFLDRNGATFLNASVQGFNQQVRNVREAKAKGLKGWLGLAGKFALAALPALLLNNLIWEDDEEYEELSDYVKDNYYVVAKTEDGTFVRIPKGRTVAVIQNAIQQISDSATGDEEADFDRFFELFMNNLAPNNPLDNSIISPIIQVANNETWYGDDLVPTRLQDLPEAEQYDESTDSLSRWLGENLNYSPYKINYLLDQYSGGIGDVFLPMMTPEAESGDNSPLGNIGAPIKDKFTTSSVMNNQNVSDFYDTVDELTANAKSSKATDEDVLKYKYMNAVNAELGELYAKKREIQNSDLADDEKYEAVREIQEQINAMARESLNSYNSVNINGVYATVGDLHFRWYEPGEDSSGEAGWKKISADQLEKQEEVTDGLGIDPSTYWNNKSEWDYAYEHPGKYAVAKSVGGYEKYKTYSSELYDIKADKDSDGKSISGSRKEKVIDYINNLDADYGEKIILFKSEYNADDTYNYDIIEYLNSREDISYEDMVEILKELGFTVHTDGRVTW